MRWTLKVALIGFAVGGGLAFFVFVVAVNLFGEPGSDFVQYVGPFLGLTALLVGGIMGAIVGPLVAAAIDLLKGRKED